MCFPLYKCFFCVSLNMAAKAIGFAYVILSAGLTVLFGVPVVLAWQVLPYARACFYASLAVASAALFVSSCLLLVAAFTRKPSLMRPWVITAWCTSMPLMALAIAGMATIRMRHSSANTAADESLIISVYFVHALLLFYFACVVNSRRRQLEDEVTIEPLMYRHYY